VLQQHRIANVRLLFFVFQSVSQANTKSSSLIRWYVIQFKIFKCFFGLILYFRGFSPLRGVASLRRWVSTEVMRCLLLAEELILRPCPTLRMVLWLSKITWLTLQISLPFHHHHQSRPFHGLFLLNRKSKIVLKIGFLFFISAFFISPFLLSRPWNHFYCNNDLRIKLSTLRTRNLA
jgi:hypothetical protein